MNSKHKKILTAAITGAVAATLAGCTGPQVECKGVAKPGSKHDYVIMDEGLCTKIDGGEIGPLAKPDQISHSQDYVMCYGIAAAGKNDCGTKSTACAGSVGQAKAPDAWVAALKGVCEQVGGKVGAIKPK